MFEPTGSQRDAASTIFNLSDYRVLDALEVPGHPRRVEVESTSTSEELLAHNRAQIDAWTGEGRTIIDVGPEPGRAFYPMETSPNYGMEHNLVRGYLGYQPMVLPGESDWWLATRVH